MNAIVVRLVDLLPLPHGPETKKSTAVTRKPQRTASNAGPKLCPLLGHQERSSRNTAILQPLISRLPSLPDSGSTILDGHVSSFSSKVYPGHFSHGLYCARNCPMLLVVAASFLVAQ